MLSKLKMMLRINPYRRQYYLLIVIDTVKCYMGTILETLGIKWIGDSIIEKNVNKLYLGIILSVSMATIQFIMLYAMTIYFNKMKGNINSFLRKNLMAHLFDRLDDNEKEMGDSYYILTEDTSEITNFYNAFYDCIGSINRFIASLIIGFTISWHLSFLIILLGFVKIGINKNIVSKLEEVVGKTVEIKSKLLANILEVFEANVFFRFFDGSIAKKRFNFLYTHYSPLYKKESQYSIVLDTLNSFLDMITIVMLLIIGAFLAFNGHITLGTLTAFLSIQDTLTNPITFLGDFFKNFQYQFVSFDRYMGKIRSCNCFKKEISEVYEGNINEIHIENVSFSYASETKVFSNFNAVIKAGEVTYIVGESGVGKSTLLKLLVGIIHPDQGEIVFWGKDSKILNPQVSYAAQRPLFFNGSVMENITLSALPDNDRLKIAIAESQLQDVFSDLTQIQDIILNAKASNLSTGQINRLALARVFYHDAPIMIFDETLSSVDNVLIPKLLSKFGELSKQGKIVVVVSHRQEWIPDDAKKIVIK